MSTLKYSILVYLLTGVCACSQAQPPFYSEADTLRGSITPERAWWDLTYYHLEVTVDVDNQSIRGKNTVQFRSLEADSILQIDLQAPMRIEKAELAGQPLSLTRNGNAWYVHFPQKLQTGTIEAVEIYFGGQPPFPDNPPWEGGMVWVKDQLGKPFIATACQGDGASLWWPCKDHYYDEPDSMQISITTPAGLMDVSNGRLRGIDTLDNNTHTYHWFVNNPINNYGVNINIADYAHFGEVYQGENGELDCDYYVLKANEELARKQFKEVPRMLEAFEHWFGPYPFYEDGFKLVEVPYLGMEHQSSVTYGNGYMNGYRGTDLSGSGWGLKFDFIIVHEAGHEWFANSITCQDVADMWIHEGFTAYSESLFLEYYFGKEAGDEYVTGTAKNILNDRPIIGPYNVAQEGSVDMYYKGANMLHTLRQWVDDDEKWRQLLRKINREFYHQVVTSKQVEAFLAKETGLNLQAFFDQYLRDTRIPELHWSVKKKKLKYRWENVVNGFEMPVKVEINGKLVWLHPASEWQTFRFSEKIKTVVPDRNFLIKSVD